MALTPEEQAELQELEALVAEEQAKQPQKSALRQAGKTVMDAAMLPVKGLTQLGNVVQEGAQKAGEYVAEKGGELGVNPNVAAGLGTAVAMAPDIVGAAVPIKNPAPVAKSLGTMARTATNPLRRMAETITGPGEEAAKIASRRAMEGLDSRLLAQQEAASTLGQRTVQRGQKLAEAKKEYGMAINKAEEVGGFGMKSSPDEFVEMIKDPKALKDFSKTMRKIGDTPIEQLVKEGDVNALQTARKFGQTFRELGPKLNREITKEITANIKMGAGKSTEALTKIDETFGSAIKEWSKVDNQIKRLGSDAKNQKAAIAQSMRHTKNAIKLTKRAMEDAVLAGARRDKVREIVVKAGLGGLIGGAAAGAGWALFK